MSIIQKLKTTAKHTLQYCWEERIRFVIAAICIVLFIILGSVENSFIRAKTIQGAMNIPNQSLIERENREAAANQANVDIFILPDCVHCHHQLEFIQNSKLELKYPELNFRVFNLQEDKNRTLLRERVIRYNMDGSRIGTPLTFFGSRYMMGFNANQLLEELDDYSAKVKEAIQARPITIVPAANFMEDEESDKASKAADVHSNNSIELKQLKTGTTSTQQSTTQADNITTAQSMYISMSTEQDNATQERPRR